MTAVLSKLLGRSTLTPIGLDVGQSALRTAQLRREGNRWSVVNLASCRRRSPDRGGDESGFAIRAARWFSELHLNTRRVVAGLSPPDVELHPIDAPALRERISDEERDEIVQQEIDRLTSFDATPAESNCWLLPASGSLRTTAIAVAAHPESINDTLQLCTAAKLACDQIDATPCALARFGAVYRGLSSADADVWSVLDLGGRMSRLIVCVGAVPVLTRTFRNGGWSWTEKLAEALSVSPATAERQKCDHGIAAVRRDEAASTTAPRSSTTLQDMVFNVLRSDLDEMSAELERSYRYVLQCFHGRSPGPLILVGGGAAMFGLDDLLQEHLGVEVISTSRTVPERCRFNFTGCDDVMRKAIGEYACAIGLALPEEVTHG